MTYIINCSITLAKLTNKSNIKDIFCLVFFVVFLLIVRLIDFNAKKSLLVRLIYLPFLLIVPLNYRVCLDFRWKNLNICLRVKLILDHI